MAGSLALKEKLDPWRKKAALMHVLTAPALLFF
jgi:hypothetical protein